MAIDPTADNVIECHDVHLWYGEFEALKGINLSVQAGRSYRNFGALRIGKIHLHSGH